MGTEVFPRKRRYRKTASYRRRHRVVYAACLQLSASFRCLSTVSERHSAPSANPKTRREEIRWPVLV